MAISPTQAQMAISVGSVVFSGVLVVVTYLYYRETQEHTEEMQNQTVETKKHTEELKAARKAEFRPVLKATIGPSLGLHNHFIFKNTGKGAAHDVTARWGFTHLDEEVEWSLPLVSPGQKHEFSLPFTEELNDISTRGQIEDELDDADGVLYFDWECTDALGNDISDREELDVLETIQKRHGVEYVQKDEQREIRKELESLTSAVDSIPRAIKDSRVEIEKTESVVQNLQKMGTVQRQQLQNLTGLPDNEIASILSGLKEAGIADYDCNEDTSWFHPDASDTVIEWTGYDEN